MKQADHNQNCNLNVAEKKSSAKQTSTRATSVRASATASSAVAVKPSSSAVAAGKIGLDSTFIYELDHSTVGSPSLTSASGVNVNANVYIVDMEHTTESQM